MQSITATELRHDHRRHRARSITAMILQVLEKHLRHDADLQAIHDDLVKQLHDAGAEIVSDLDRAQHGLPPRGPDGWTGDELRELEQARLTAMLRPANPVFLKSP